MGRGGRCQLNWGRNASFVTGEFTQIEKWRWNHRTVILQNEVRIVGKSVRLYAQIPNGHTKRSPQGH